jgi:5,10-methylenetetrahydromethanopterin reductase
VEISCAFPASPNVVQHIRDAESLGYERAWLYDSPALYGDVWMVLALAAAQTERIGLGPAVLVPNLRHPLTQASAIATLEQLAPGRAAVAIGTGFTGRMAMGKKALGWTGVREYIAQVRALLRGEAVEVDGAMVQMLHAAAFAPARPIATPIVVAANGPKGLAVAGELGDGVMTIGGGNPDFEWCSVLAFGTVLDDGEDPGSPRALAAAGPGLTVVFHAMYERNPEAVDALPGGADWRARVEAVPEELRHLAVHEDHLVGVTDRDRPLLDGELLRAFTWTGTRAEMRARLDALEAAGGTEILYAPMGPDIARELEAFAEVGGLV